MYINAIKDEFGDGGVVIFCTRVDSNNLKAQLPLGGIRVIVAQCAHLEALHIACVFKV